MFNLLTPLLIFFEQLFGPILGSKTQQVKLPGSDSQIYARIKRLTNAKLSSKSAFSPQEHPKSSQTANI